MANSAPTGNLNPPTNVTATVVGNSIQLTWEYGFNDDDDIFSSQSSSVYRASSISFPGPTLSNVKFEIGVSVPNTSFYTTLETSWAESPYSYSIQGTGPFKFRIRAVNLDSSTDSYQYSNYVETQSIAILNKVTISPSAGVIDSAQKITLSSADNASIKYKLVATNSTCSDSGWSNYNSSFLLPSSKRVCAKATKNGQIDSQISFADYNLRLNSPTIAPVSSSITPDTLITLSSSQGAALKYKLVPKNQSCSDSSWQSYTTSFSISAAKRVCAKATKSGWVDSQIIFRDFNILDSSTFGSQTTVAPSDGSFSQIPELYVESIGAIDGNASVQGGAASYTMPINLPPSRAGFQPSVSLNYSSRSGNGIAGVGWSLSAGSSISRCAATYAQDGFAQSPQYNNKDRLCINGQRLIATSGVYGNSGTVYRTEIDSFTRVTQNGSLNGSSTWFKVEDKSGSVAYYGKTANSQLIHTGKSASYSWLVDYQHDSTNKNFINYEYIAESAGEKLLQAIYYTVNSATSTNGQSVEFEYEDKNIFYSSFAAGGESRTTQRLKSITVNSFGNEIRKYSLAYKTSTASGRGLLQSVQLCENGSNCFEPTLFDWHDSEQSYVVEPMGENGNMLYSNISSLSAVLPRGDINGDGVRDWQGYYVNAEGEFTQNNIQFENCTKNPFTLQSECHDGDFDLDGRSDEWFINSGVLKIKLSSSGSTINAGISMPVSTYFGLRDSHIRSIADFNNDGWPDVVVFKPGATPKVEIYLNVKSKTRPFSTVYKTFNLTKYSAGSSKYTLSTDINSVGDLTGDGTIDFIKVKTGAGNRISFLQPIPTELYLGDDNYSNVHSSPFDVSEDPLAPGLSYLMDINGDGLSDWLGLEYQGSSKYLMYRLNEGNLAFASEVLLDSGLVATKPEYIYHSSSEQDLRTVPKYLGAFKIEDINNDGKAELLMPDSIIYEGCALIPSARPSHHVSKKCGNQLYGFTYTTEALNSKQSINSSTADKSIYQFSAIHFTQSKSGTISATKKLTPIIGSAYDSAFVDAFGTGLRSFVFNHKLDEGYSFNGSASGEFSGYEDDYGIYINRNYGAGSGNDGGDYSPVDIIKSIENGLGVKSEWYLRPLTSNSLNYDRLESEVVNGNDYFNFASSMYVVANFKQSNGLGGFNESKYNYLGAVYNGQGRGFMGFKSIIVEDVTKGIVTQSDFEQVFPYQGKLTRQATFAKENYGSHNLLNAESSETQALSFKEIEWLDNPNHSIAGVYSIYPKTTKIITRLPSTSESSSNSYSKTKVSTQTVTVNSIDKYGNVKEKVTQLTDGWGVNKTTEVMSYNYDENTWFLDKLTSKTLTKHALTSRNSQDPITSTTELDPTAKVVTNLTNYHANRKPRNITVSGLHGTSTSGKGTTTVTTYNDYGLPTQVSATAQVRNSSGSWVNQTRTTKTAYSKDGNTIAVDGYFPYELKNAKNHLSYTHVNPATGKVTKTRQQLSGSSYLTTVYTYDDYNRPFSSKTDGQPIVYTAVQLPDAQAPTNAVLQVVSVSAGQPTQKIYQDKLGRVLRTAVEDFNGDWVFTDVEYNDLGYKIFESIPYKEGNTAYGVSYTGYDILGRLTEKVTNQHCGDMTTTYAYAGLKTDITASEDCEGKTIDMSRTYNSLKQLMETVDANNGITRYSYNGQGLPAVIQDANSNKIIAKYNALGRKTKVNDPNQGVTNFEYNGFGELQKESRVGSKTLTYITDVLGRVTRRTATGENTLNYTYDGATYGLGQLNQATGNGVTKSFSFDSLGRATTQTIAGSGKTYKTTTFYDANYGRVKGLRYPNNLTISYDYSNSGYLQSIKNTASGYIYKTVTDQDAFGNITAADLGNGTLETSTFSSRNGQMLLKAVNKASNNLMNISYQSYDGFGNLKQVDVSTGNMGIDLHQFTETYDYDNLHRLERNYVDGHEVTNYSYDAIGNLLSKSDYATQYDYINGSTGGPNAVKRVYRNGWKLIGYDARGNMTSGDGLTSAIYNAMDKPTQIKKAGKTLDFTYGPQHMRFKQVNGSVTTFYIDKLYEEEVSGSKTTWRAYVDDIAVISQTTSESATIRYTHKDRLGSARIFTDKNGYVTAQRNFDPFGKPRLASGSLMPYGNSKLNDLDKAKTHRGFTDHEHLDDVELIHMNGRVYDYNLGRFMSVDPVIQSPTNSQSINPYSYIMNNPLSGTDPTGYAAEIEKEKIKVSKIGSKIKRTVGEKITVTTTNDAGQVTNRSTQTVIGSDVAVTSTNFENGAVTSSTSAVMNGKTMEATTKTITDIGSPATVGRTSISSNTRFASNIDTDGNVYSFEVNYISGSTSHGAWGLIQGAQGIGSGYNEWAEAGGGKALSDHPLTIMGGIICWRRGLDCENV
ncbi:SpvB/TcaC N-terminal domain-containing protein [Pseudoalteromonas sp. Hal040]|uniref:SpvB/TcaC N-terminal domain-containing protein n=1 Tax=unclassified Pseudoalteromonas TaxID=194690 RepID=UPI00301C4103